MSDLKTTIENAIQRTVEEMSLYDEFLVKRYLVESPHAGPLPKTRWMVYEFPEYVACVPDGELLTSSTVKCYDKTLRGERWKTEE